MVIMHNYYQSCNSKSIQNKGPICSQWHTTFRSQKAFVKREKLANEMAQSLLIYACCVFGSKNCEIQIDLEKLARLCSTSHHCREFWIVDSTILLKQQKVRKLLENLESWSATEMKDWLTLSVSTSEIISLIVSSSPMP